MHDIKKKELVLELLNAGQIRKSLRALGSEDIGEIHVFSAIPSTNDYLLEDKANSHQVAVCIAEQQTQGRGRYGHHWVSPSAANLYLSLSWPVRTEELKFDALGLWLLIAVAELLEKYQCANIQLKWPNDICVEDKKLAGVLIERRVSESRNNLIIGVGINVAMSLKEEIQLETPWVDLLMIKPDWPLSRNELAAEVIANLCETLSKFENNELGDLNAKWSRYDMLLNKQVSFHYKDDSSVGCVKGIDEFGQIIIKTNGKLESMHSAYISEIRRIT